MPRAKTLHDKMLCITNFQGTTNQNHNEGLAHYGKTVIAKTTDNKNLQEFSGKEALVQTRCGYKLEQP